MLNIHNMLVCCTGCLCAVRMPSSSRAQPLARSLYRLSSALQFGLIWICTKAAHSPEAIYSDVLKCIFLPCLCPNAVMSISSHSRGRTLTVISAHSLTAQGCDTRVSDISGHLRCAALSVSRVTQETNNAHEHRSVKTCASYSVLMAHISHLCRANAGHAVILPMCYWFNPCMCTKW
ncbi:hypothetical protein NL108_018629 [Boleophthalmus pectinirostris]|nr:hypothetical protein NL108_018629 [Boleophthalmus pectinirostris]